MDRSPISGAPSNPSSGNYALLDNFAVSIAKFISQGLTDRETERLISFNELLRQLSQQNLTRLKQEAPYTRPYCKHHGTCRANAFRGFFESFLVTYAVKYGLGFVPAMLRGQIFRNPKTLLWIGGRETISFALFMATLVSAYKGTLCACRRIFPKTEQQKLNSCIAGTVCGLSLLLDRNKSRRIMIALYLSTRTMHFVARWVWRHYIERLFDSNEQIIDLNAVRDDRMDPTSSDSSSEESDGRVQVDAPGFPNPAIPVSMKPSPASIALPKNSASAQKSTVRANQARKTVRSVSGTVIMMLSSAQILYAYLAAPDSLAKSYLGFLIVHGNGSTLYPPKPRLLLDTIASVINSSTHASSTRFIPDARDFTASIPPGLPTEHLARMQEYFTRVPHEYIMCAAQHPDHEKCHRGFLQAFECEWPRAFALYAPLNAIMTVVFRGPLVLKEPGRTLRGFIVQSIRSTLFLAGYVSTAWSLPCLFRRVVGKDHPWMYYLNGIIAGTWVMIEHPGRRLELGLYCLPRALQSLWNCWVEWGWVKNIPGGEALYFCLSMCILMNFYQNDPESIHDGYRKIMIWLLGVN